MVVLIANRNTNQTLITHDPRSESNPPTTPASVA